MRLPRFAGNLLPLPALIAALALPRMAPGQSNRPDPPASANPAQAASAPAEESIQAINEQYDQKLLQLDRERLERLGRLAGRQKPADAAATYEQLFRLGIAANLFRETETAADAVVNNGSPSPTTLGLAHLMRIVARADRGAFEDSLDCLRQALSHQEKQGQAGGNKANLTAVELVGICEAYYERLVHEGQYEIARKALRLALDVAQEPVVKDFLRSRLNRIELLGKPAPPIRGTDMDGKPFDLAASRGKVVLIVFWASWCLPSASEVEWLEQAYDAYRGRGLQIVGINLDALQDGGQKLETVLPSVRRFLLDYNVRWPNLMSGTDDRDYARAYGITDIPANVLVDRNGNVVQVDMVRKNFEPILARVVGP
jgi:thiol-disulfide isomerase/thioredoxin